MRKLLIVVFCFIALHSHAQTDSSKTTIQPQLIKSSYTTLIEKEPRYPGGKQDMLLFIDKNIDYPQMAKDSFIEGTVKVRFTVTVTGELTNFIVIINRGKPIGYGLEEAAVQVVKKMPKWIPGSQNGVIVPLTYNLPIKFSLPLSAKADGEKVPKDVYLISNTKPKFPGGKEAMIQFIAHTLQYPQEAIEDKIEGKILLKFIIDSVGKVCCVDYVGEPIGYGLEEEAIRIVRAMPKWIPALQDNKPVAVYYRMPITFKYYEE